MIYKQGVEEVLTDFARIRAVNINTPTYHQPFYTQLKKCQTLRATSVLFYEIISKTQIDGALLFF